MENFREKIKIQNLTIGICAFALTVFSFLAAAGEAGLIPFFAPVGGDSHWQSIWRGFCCGAAFGVLAVLVFFLVRNILALQDEKKLKKLYVKENDERQIQIWTSARAGAFQASILLGLVAVIVAGYFSMTVSLTILAYLWVNCLIGIGFKVYYSIKL